MVNRKELDRDLKNILLKYIQVNGSDLIKLTWDDLSEVLGLDLQKTKYQIARLDQEGFLQLVERSQRSEGHTSPNIIKILSSEKSNGNTEDVVVDIKKNLSDLQKWAQDLTRRERNIQQYEDEIKRLTIEKSQDKAKIESLTKQIFELNQTILELRPFGR
jgi:nucleotidyltransferase/DNA polymerase involved in DNA repair